MGLFGKDNRPGPIQEESNKFQQPIQPVQKPRVQTIISPDTNIKGTITGNGDVTIHGRFEGKINISSNVNVEKTGIVMADIQAGNIVISGKVTGNLSGRDMTEIKPQGILEGDIVSPKVIIAEGAIFKGSVDMKMKPLHETSALKEEEKNKENKENKEKKEGRNDHRDSDRD